MPSLNYLDSLVWIWRHQLNIQDSAMSATTTLPPRPSTTRSTQDNPRAPRATRPATTASTGRTPNHHEPPSKKKTIGKDLSFYLEYVISNTPLGGLEAVCSDSQHHNELLGLTAARLLGKLSEVLQMRSRRFAQTFQPLLPVGEDPGKALKVEMRGGERHLDVKVLLKRPIYPNMFEVRTGHVHGLPPGCALYRIRKCQSQEQDLVMRRMWRCCMDKEGFVSPLKVYPWLAKAVVDAVVYLRERDRQWADLDFRLHATFPVIRMELTFRKKPTTSRQPTATGNRTTSAQSNHSLRPEGDEDCETRQWDNQSQSNIEISKLSQTLSIPESPRKPTSRATSARSAAYMELRNSARYSESGRRSAHSMVSTRPSSAWEFLFNEDEDEDEITGEPAPPGTLYLNLIPTIEGFGWPKSVRMPQVLPNQRPWSIKAKQWVSDLREQIVNGESFWELTAFDPINVIHPSRKEYVPYWRISYKATNDYFLSRITDELAFSSTLDGVLDVIEMATSDVGKIWAFLGSEIKDDIRICAIRENLHRNRTLAEWYLAVLESTIRSLQEHQLQAGRAQGEVTILSENDKGDNTYMLEGSDEGNRLLEALLQVQMMSHEDPKKLVERIQLNDPAAEDDLALPVRPPPDQVMKSSTPVITRRASMITLEKPLVVSEPPKPQRNLYRLFRKDL